MNARQVLGMDSNGRLLVGIAALQKLLNTLKEYKKDNERLTFLLKDKEDQSNYYMEQVNMLEAHINVLNKQIDDLESQQFTLRCVDSINLEEL